MKDFFKNSVVQTIAWVLWVLSTVVLVIGGVGEAQFNAILVILLGIVAGVSALIVAIGKLINKKE